MRRIGWALALCFWLIVLVLPWYTFLTSILVHHSPLWLIPFAIFMLISTVLVYKQKIGPIIKNFIRNEPLAIDRSNETPYEFDNPYTPKKKE